MEKIRKIISKISPYLGVIYACFGILSFLMFFCNRELNAFYHFNGIITPLCFFYFSYIFIYEE